MRVRQYPRQENRLLKDLSDLKAEFGDALPKIIPSWTTSPDDDFEKDVRPLLDFAVAHEFVVKFLPLKVNQHADWEKQRSIILQAIEYAGPQYVTNQLGHTVQLETQYGGRNCLVQGNQFYIDYEGQFLYPCDEYAHQKVGSVYEHDLDELYEEGVRRFGNYPRNDGICAHCPSGCHSDNSYILRFPERQLQWLA
jgi:MoaA/NifB/PqqE/SkfB family radical SAM enzyme